MLISCGYQYYLLFPSPILPSLKPTYSPGLYTCNFPPFYTSYVFVWVPSHQLFHWVYAPIILAGFTHSFVIRLGLHALYFVWVYAPIILPGTMHLLFYLGLRTLYFVWVYAPSILSGFTHPLFYLGLRTHYFSSRFTHPLFIWVYAPSFTAWVYIPSAFVRILFSQFFVWSTHHLLLRFTHLPLCGPFYTPVNLHLVYASFLYCSTLCTLLLVWSTTYPFRSICQLLFMGLFTAPLFFPFRMYYHTSPLYFIGMPLSPHVGSYTCYPSRLYTPAVLRLLQGPLIFVHCCTHIHDRIEVLYSHVIASLTRHHGGVCMSCTHNVLSQGYSAFPPPCSHIKYTLSYKRTFYCHILSISQSS